jgi:hypothetical protein
MIFLELLAYIYLNQKMKYLIALKNLLIGSKPNTMKKSKHFVQITEPNLSIINSQTCLEIKELLQ